jgi:hypothetical protein
MEWNSAYPVFGAMNQLLILCAVLAMFCRFPFKYVFKLEAKLFSVSECHAFSNTEEVIRGNAMIVALSLHFCITFEYVICASLL